MQTRAQLITLGWSPCCLCPHSARSQPTTWRFISGTAQLPTTPKLSSSTVRFLTLSTWGVEIMEQSQCTFRYTTLKTLAICCSLSTLLYVISTHFLLKMVVFSDGAVRCLWSSQACSHIPLLFLYLYLWFHPNAQLHRCFGCDSASFSTLPDRGSRKKCVLSVWERNRNDPSPSPFACR